MGHIRDLGNKKIRDLESVNKKISRHKNHLTFTHRCKDLNLTPVSLKLKCPIRTNNAKKIIEKAEKELVRERIRVISNKISNLESKHNAINVDIETRVNPEVKTQVDFHVNSSRVAESEKCKIRQIRKLDRLREKSEAKLSPLKRHDNVDLSGNQLKKWVTNLSKHKLTEPEENVLQKGLNFAVSCDNIPNEEFIVATEKACSFIPADERPALRAEIVGVLRNAKPPQSNITKEERLAINSLKKNDSILIMGADKGRSTVVLDKVDYDEKVHEMLKDERTYEKLKVDPTPKYKRKLTSILARLKKENKIDEKQYKLLYPTTANTPRLYCTTKIHVSKVTPYDQSSIIRTPSAMRHPKPLPICSTL